MSKSSDAVKRWRNNTKNRIIEAMGGKCALCSYSRCASALELHHLDPDEKEISLSGIRANPKSWDKIVNELRKCVLLCAICHREFHDGLIILPDDLPGFDESFSNYHIKLFGETKPCPKCGEEMASTNKVCSVSCAAKLKSSVDWTRYDIFEMLQSKTYAQIADEIGCSSATVWKRHRKLTKEK